MNYQIIENAPFLNYFKVHVIFWKMEENTSKDFKDTFTTTHDVLKFRFSRYDNYFHVLKSFHRLLNKWPGLIITNDSFEIEAIAKFGTSSIVSSIIHDFYNLKIAINSLSFIDNFICHSILYEQTLLSSSTLTGRVFYLPHGVRVEKNIKRIQTKSKLKVISISRLAKSKGIMHLYDIDDLLLSQGVEIEWIVVGSGDLEVDVKVQWENKTNIIFLHPNTSLEVMKITQAADIFISPSIFEGYGIALLEAMACGLVPIVYKLPVGIYSSLPEKVGFSIEIGDIVGFAKYISLLNFDRDLLSKMSLEAKLYVSQHYDIKVTAENYLNAMRKMTSLNFEKNIIKKNMSSFGVFDRRYIPNRLSRLFKKLNNYLQQNVT